MPRVAGRLNVLTVLSVVSDTFLHIFILFGNGSCYEKGVSPFYVSDFHAINNHSAAYAAVI